MLRRCSTRSKCPQLLQCHRRNSIKAFQRVIYERSYATETRARHPYSRKWHLFAVVGVIGFTIGSWYRIIAFRNKKQDSFQPFELVSKETVSSTASIFTIKTKSNNISTSAWKAGVWNIEFKQPQIQIVRSYTPLPPLPGDIDHSDESVSCLRFLIRRDARGGEMSSYLHKLGTGAKIELRGPNVEYIVPKDAKNVVFVAGGTGIATAMQVAHSMFNGLTEQQRRGKKLHILWANRAREDCAGGVDDKRAVASTAQPSSSSSWSGWLSGESKQAVQTQHVKQEPNQAVRILNDMKCMYGSSLSVSYFVDEEKSYIHSGNLTAAIGQKDTEEDTATQVIVSGPPGFITYVAGPKVWKDGEEQQGSVGGRLAQVIEKKDIGRVEVWKV